MHKAIKSALNARTMGMEPKPTDQDRAYQDPLGIWRWKSNDHVPFADMLESWGLTRLELELHAAARSVDTELFLSQYRDAQSYLSEEEKAEQAFERRAAFGPGVTVVNVITGKKFRS